MRFRVEERQDGRVRSDRFDVAAYVDKPAPYRVRALGLHERLCDPRSRLARALEEQTGARVVAPRPEPAERHQRLPFGVRVISFLCEREARIVRLVRVIELFEQLTSKTERTLKGGRDLASEASRSPKRPRPVLLRGAKSVERERRLGGGNCARKRLLPRLRAKPVSRQRVDVAGSRVGQLPRDPAVQLARLAHKLPIEDGDAQECVAEREALRRPVQR